jgi:ubiquinol-cytochrome c reductase cytochrome b subunit
VLMMAIDAKFWGVVVMGGAVLILFFLPWLDYSPVKSIRYRPTWQKWLYGVFVVNFFLLMPWWSRIGEFKPVPDRVTFAAH